MGRGQSKTTKIATKLRQVCEFLYPFILKLNYSCLHRFSTMEKTSLNSILFHSSWFFYWSLEDHSVFDQNSMGLTSSSRTRTICNFILGIFIVRFTVDSLRIGIGCIFKKFAKPDGLSHDSAVLRRTLLSRICVHPKNHWLCSQHQRKQNSLYYIVILLIKKLLHKLSGQSGCWYDRKYLPQKGSVGRAVSYWPMRVWKGLRPSIWRVDHPFHFTFKVVKNLPLKFSIDQM